MIDLYYWPTPNGHKVTIFLEEAGLDYTVHPVRISEGEQFERAFLNISPNNKIPAVVDHEPADGGEPFALFESAAILEYLADKTGRFLPLEGRERYQTLQWLHWQGAGLSPVAGQNFHFARAAEERIPHAIDRFVDETRRLFGVLDRRLEGRDWIAGDYSIADMACYPWVLPWEMLGQDMGDFPALEAWFQRMCARAAVQGAYRRIEEYPIPEPMAKMIRRKLLDRTDE